MDNRSAGRFATRQLGLEQDTPNPRAEERAFDMSSKRAALAFVGPILFLFFLFTAWGDLSFALWGRDVEGHLVDWVAVKHTGAPDGVNAQVRILDEEGKEIVRRREFPSGFRVPADRKVPVRYLPHAPTEWRVEGEKREGASSLFLFCAALALTLVGWWPVIRTLFTGWRRAN